MQQMSALKDRISEQTKAAMRSGDKARLSALRMLLAAIKQQEVDSRKDLDDAAVSGIVTKMIKKGRDAQSQFAAAGREDLANKEAAEVALFEEFMPQQLTAEETAAAIATAIRATGAVSIRDMGKVMAELKTAVAGRADFGALSAQVRSQLESL
jgi:hypothetical protein